MSVQGIVGASADSVVGIVGATVSIGQYIINDYVITLTPIEGDYGYTMTITKGSEVQTITMYGLSTEQYDAMLGYLEQAQTASAAAETAQEGAEDARDAAQAALNQSITYANNAAASATAASTSADNASTYEYNAAQSLYRSIDARDRAEAAKTAAQAAQTAAESAATSAGNAQTAAGAAQTAAETAETNAQTYAGQASQSATNAATSAAAAAQTLTQVQAEGATQIAAIDAEGQRVLDSIPADYSQMEADVTDLKSQMSAVDAVLPKDETWQSETVVENSGYYNRSGEQKSSQYANYAMFDYKDMPYKVTCSQMPNNATIAPIVYIDQAGNVLGVEPSDNSTKLTDYVLTVPDGTAKIVINYTVNNVLYVYTQPKPFVDVAPKSTVDDITERMTYTWVNVKDYGAKGDGITNDKESIQAALDYAETRGGGIVFFPFGVYSVSRIGSGFMKSYLYVSSNIKLLFENGATIKRGDDYSAHIIMTKNDASAGGYTGAHNIIISGAIIDYGGGNNGCTGVCLSHTDNALIENCIFKNGVGVWHYIECNSSRFVRIVNCDFQPSNSMNMYLQIEAASGHGNGGLNDNTPAYNVDICKCRFVKGSYNSMAICNEDTDDPSSDIRVHDCIFSGGTGIWGYIRFTQGIKNVDIYNNTFVPGETSYCGLRIDDITGSCTVHDNRFDGFTKSIDGTPIAYNNMIDGVLTNTL